MIGAGRVERWIRLDKLAQVRGETSKMPTFRGVGDAAGIIKEYLGHHGAFVEESGGHERRTSGLFPASMVVHSSSSQRSTSR